MLMTPDKVTDNNSRSKNKAKIPKKVSLPVIFLVIIIALAGLYAGIFKDKNNQEPPNLERSQTDRPPTIAEQADKLNFDGKYEEAQKLLDENISKSTSPEEKGSLYEAKSLMALNADKLDEALTYAQQAENISPTRNSAVLIAMTAEEKGDKSLAIEYYQKVLDRTSPLTLEEDKQYYKDKIEMLGE